MESWVDVGLTVGLWVLAMLALYFLAVDGNPDVALLCSAPLVAELLRSSRRR